MVAPIVSQHGRWHNLRLSTRLRATLVALVVALAVAGLALILVLREADRAVSLQTDRAYPARLAASQMLSALIDQQNGLRGYALTGDDVFLEPYTQGQLDEKAARARLRRLIRPGDPAQLELASVDAAITAWRDQYASLHTTPASTQNVQATIGIGKELFDTIRRATRALDTELARESNAADDQAHQDRQIVVGVMALMAVAVGAVVYALQRSLETSVLQPMQRLSDQVGTVSSGNHRAAISPHGPPDFQIMGAGVESMRVELVNALASVEAQQRDLEQRAMELARSNADLEQFAYVASHDLQEPLRKISSFCQLLEQRYHDQLDDRGRQYIDFAVDGARRMQLLITDLLMFSRVGRTSAGFTSVDIASLVNDAWHGLETQVDSSGAELRTDIADDAGTVVGDPSLLALLVTNLLNNAVKYRRPDTAPIIEVTVARNDGMAHVTVADNGIGIPEEYAEKVFVIFQRLHGRDEYEGTGIGLALVKKIIEFHGGRVTLVPSPLGGACISFSLPLAESSARV